jgi:polysaccharide biosynthesis protein PslG
MKLKCLLTSLLFPVAAFAGNFPPLVVPQGVGVNIHFTRGHERDLDLIAAAGFRFIRMDFGWGGTERQRGQFNWADYDELTTNLERRGLHAIYIFDYSNGLYEDAIVSRDPISGRERRDTASPQKPESVAAFARWAAAAAAHFKGRPVIWEIWNEPNIGFWKPKPDVQQYITLVRAVAGAVRQADPSATIVAPASSEFPWSFLEELLSAPGVLAQLDGVSVHPYRGQAPETVADDYLRLRALIERFAPPDKKSMPILSGEWGYATHSKGLSLEKQAAYVARQQLVNLLHSVPVSIWYDWKNDGLDPAYNEHNFGTVSNDLALKPSYVAVQTLSRQLSGYRVARRLATPTREEFLLLFVNAAGDQKLAAWTTGEPRTLALDLGLRADDLSAVNGQGRPLLVRERDGAPALALEMAPQYVTLKRRSERLTAEAAWSHAFPVPVLVEGAAPAGVSLPLRVNNPFSDTVQVRVALQWPQGSDGVEFELAAGQNAERAVTLKPARRGPENLEASLSLEFRKKTSQGPAGWVAVSREPLAFRLSNPLITTLAPAEKGLWLIVQNPGRSRFDGFALVNRTRLPLELSASTREVALPAPAEAVSSLVTAQLLAADGRAVTDPVAAAFTFLPPMPMKCHLDGSAAIPAQASLVETNLPPDPLQPFSKVWRLDYQFEAGWRFVRCAPALKEPFRISGRPTALGLWVYGDRSGNLLRMRVVDSTGQTFQPNGPALDWTGWRWVSFDLVNLKNAGHWGGPNDGVARGELRLDAPLLLDGSSRKTAGTICFAGLSLIEPPAR